MKGKNLSTDLRNVQKRKTVITVLLALVMAIALICTAGCNCKGCTSKGDSTSSDSYSDDTGDTGDTGDSDDSDDTGDSLVKRIVVNGVEDNAKLCDDAIYEYFTAATQAEQIAALQKYAKLTEEKGGKSVKFSWDGNGSVKYTLYLADNEQFDNAVKYTISGLVNELDVYDLLPSTTYFWKVGGTLYNDESEVSQFTTDDLSVRYIFADGAVNTRDLGGYAAQGGVVNYGKIYRGGIGSLTAAGKNGLKDELKIKTEIDLRGCADKSAVGNASASAYYNLTVGAYTDIFDYATWSALSDAARRKNCGNNGKYAAQIKKLFKVLADENNYPVYVYDDKGADETGTIAFLINALLGVSEGDLIKDYELSSFSKTVGARYRSALNEGKTAFDESGVMVNDDKTKNFVAFGAMVNAVKGAYGSDGKSLSYAVESYLADFVGVPRADIEKVKKIMLSNYTENEVICVNGDRQVVETTKATNAVSLGEIKYSSVESISVGKINLGNSLDAIDGRKLASVYGERELTVKINAENGQKTVKVPVLVVTKYITTADELKNALKLSKNGNYGYYELKNDVTVAAFENDAVAFSGNNGFCGIFEGNGHTITGALGAHGLFGYVRGGAVVRNVNFAVSGGLNETNKSVIGDYVIDSVIENVKVNVSAAAFGAEFDGVGLITAKGLNGSEVSGLTVNAAETELNSLFGCNVKYAFAGNEFKSCFIKVKGLGELARYFVNGNYSSVYLESTSGFSGEITNEVGINSADMINVDESNVVLTVGARFAASNVESITCNGVEIERYKFENGVLYLYNDYKVFGKDLSDVTFNVTYKGVNGIIVKTKINAFTITEPQEVALSGRQEILVTAATNSVDLKEYGGGTVYAITCGGHYLGANANALNIGNEFKVDGILHGEQVLRVILLKDGVCYSVSVPVTIVTAEISTLEQFNAVFTPKTDDYVVFGYYKIVADLGGKNSTINFGMGGNWQNVDGHYGFRGTLDGNGRSVTGVFGNNGLFGIVGKGAVIKNLTLNVYGYSNGRATIARTVRGATVDSVNINVKSGESKTWDAEGGVITSIMSHSTEYKNVVINSAGAVDTLFGLSYWNYDRRLANTFDNCAVTVKSIVGLLCVTTSESYIGDKVESIDNVQGLTVSFVRTYEDKNNVILMENAVNELNIGKDNADVDEITSVKCGDKVINNFTFADEKLTITEKFTPADIGSKTLVLIGTINGHTATVNLPVTVTVAATEVKLDGTREIVLNDGSTYSLNLGDYTNKTALYATVGGTSASYANGTLTLSAEYKANTIKHGYQTITVLFKDGDSYFNVTANALVITQEIKTVEELVTVSGRIYGYYRLANDLLNTSDRINVVGSGDWKNADGQSGFRGTLDGNGKTISGWSTLNGLFGIVGQGAVIKNLTYTLTAYEPGGATFARTITGATIENVTINVLLAKPSVAINQEGGVITGLMSQRTLYKNVTINADGQDIDSLFGTSWNYYKESNANTFVNCKMFAKSLAGLINAGSPTVPKVVSAAGIEGLTVTLAYGDIEEEEILEIGKEYGVLIDGVTEITSVMLDDNDFTAYSFENGRFTVNADAFGVTDGGKKIFVITGKNTEGYTVKFKLTVTAELKATPAPISGTREVVLGNGNEYNVDLGDYSSATVLNATIGGEKATYANGKLTLTEEFKANTQKHGNQELSVIVEQGGAYYNVTTTVLVVTQEIGSFDDLKTAVTLDKNYVKYGYYRLKTSLSTDGHISYGYVSTRNGVQNTEIWRADGEYGFRGTFDGNGLSMTAAWNGSGIFGVLGRGAVVKNVTLVHTNYVATQMILGYTMIGATLNNVKVTVSGSGPSGIPNNAVGGLLTAMASYDSTLTGVEINSQNTALDTLFGNGKYYTYPKTYNKNEFDSCVVNAKSLVALSCEGGDAAKAWIYNDAIKGLTVNTTAK